MKKWNIELSTTDRNNVGLIQVRQNNKKHEVLEVQVTENGMPYDFSKNCVSAAYFCSNAEGKYSTSQPAHITDYRNGKLQYTINDKDMQKRGVHQAYFKFLDEFGNYQGSTQSFSYRVIPSIEKECVRAESYFSNLEELYKMYLDFHETQKGDLEAFLEEYKDIITGIDADGRVLAEIVASRGDFDSLYERLEYIEKNGKASNLNYFSNGFLREEANIERNVLPHEISEELSNEEINQKYESLRHTDFYQIYDNLVDKFPRTSSAHSWGEEETGLELKWYKFEARNRYNTPKNKTGEYRFDAYNRQKQAKPILFITSGVHGNEKSNMWAMTMLISDIVNGVTEIDRFIRNNYDIILLPVVNPSGVNSNERWNSRKVDLNRNFPYRWDLDGGGNKGDKPFSEKGTQFIRDVRKLFISDIPEKYGILCVDSHDFDYRNYENNRILWCGSNDKKVRESIIKTGSVLKEKIEEEFPKIKEQCSSGWINIGATGTGYGSTQNAWNFDSGLKGFSLECPAFITPLELDTRYSLETSKLAYYIVRDMIINVCLDACGVPPKDTLVGFRETASRDGNAFLKILQDIPSGREFITGSYAEQEENEVDDDEIVDTQRFFDKMPYNRHRKNNYKGVFSAKKSDASTSKSGFMQFVTTNWDRTKLFVSSFNHDEVNEWTELQEKHVYTTFEDLELEREKASIKDVNNALEIGDSAELFLTGSTNKINTELPKNFGGTYGYLKIKKLSNIMSVVHLENMAAKKRLYKTSINSTGVLEWTEFQSIN